MQTQKLNLSLFCSFVFFFPATFLSLKVYFIEKCIKTLKKILAFTKKRREKTGEKEM
jgi:hypothetical protein